MIRYIFTGCFASLFTILLLAPNLSSAQETTTDTTFWKRKFSFTANVNQAAFSSNWKAGGINSLGVNSLLNYKTNYRRDRASWDNEFDFGFGFVDNAGQGYRKTLDRMFLDTKYGYRLGDIWGLYMSLNFLSQFAEGYNYKPDNTQELISDIFAPAFITSAWGLEYHPREYFKVRLSPFAPRLTIVNDPRRFTKSVGPQPYGVDSTSTTRFEWVSFMAQADFNKEIVKNINLKWRYMMYANYETLAARTIDHRLDIDFLAKVNRYINVSLGGILIYDYDQDTGVQLSQIFSLGFLYTLQNYQDPPK